jgi:hypothetical protein
VADPRPSLALTTSSPPNWMRLVRAGTSALGVRGGWDCERMGRIVIPEWPPSTGTVVVEHASGVPLASATKVEARTTSRVVIPKILPEARS